jgi:hypothetical protein
MSARKIKTFHESYSNTSAESLAAFEALRALRARLQSEIRIDEYEKLFAFVMTIVERYAYSVRKEGRDMALEDYRLIMTYYGNALENCKEAIENHSVEKDFRTKVLPKWQAASDWIDVTAAKLNLKY